MCLMNVRAPQARFVFPMSDYFLGLFLVPFIIRFLERNKQYFEKGDQIESPIRALFTKM